jgi:hypothetical protein
MESYMEFPRKHNKVPYDPAISLLGSQPKGIKSVCQRDICTPVFITAHHNNQEMETTYISIN